MLAGQISFKKYSYDDIKKTAQENYQRHYKFKHFRIGSDVDFLEDYFKMESYRNFYECLEDEIKEEVNTQTQKKCNKHSLKAHCKHYRKHKCDWCEEFKILRECAPKIEW